MALNFLNDGYFAGKVGIGTEGPTSKLDIRQSTSGGSDVLGTGSITIGSDNPYWTLRGTATSLQDLAFDRNYSGTWYESMRIQRSTGNVGIGTISPAFKLTVDGIGSEGAIGIERDTVSASTIIGALNFTNNNGGTIYGRVRGGRNSNGDGYASLGTGLGDNLYAIEGGNVGIGTTSPSAPLEIYQGGSGKVTLLQLARPNTAGLQSNIQFTVADIMVGQIQHEYEASNLNHMSFTLRAVSGSDIIPLWLENSGNVGIGTTTPTSKLDLRGTLRIDGGGNSYIYSDASGVNFETSGARFTRFYTNGSERMRIDSSGNVGIGTTGPLYKLDVNGTFHASGDSAIDGNLTLGSTKLLKFGGNGARIYGDNANNFLTFDTNSLERMRITSAGGISFGSTGTAYGTSGQVLTSAGNASPTWTTPTTGTVTGSGSATQVAFWNGSSSLSGNNKLYWDDTNGCLGINDTTPSSRLKVAGGASDTSIYTVDINHVRNNPDVGTHAMRLNVDLSGADNTTADRLSSGLLVDIDSSANGDASNEHRIYGVNSSVNFTGFTDLARGGYFLAESNYTGAKTSQLIGVFGNAVHDVDDVAGGVSNMMGVYGTSSIQDKGDVDNAYGGFFSVVIPDSRTETVGTTIGVQGEVEINKATALNYGTMIGVSSLIDNNETTFPNFGSQYLFKGDYQGDKGANAYGIYCEGDKHYLTGNLGVGVANPTQVLHVAGNARVTGAYYDSNNSPGTANQVLISTVTGTDWVDGSGSSIIGGPYLPLTAGSGKSLTGTLYGTNTNWSGDGDYAGNHDFRHRSINCKKLTCKSGKEEQVMVTHILI